MFCRERDVMKGITWDKTYRKENMNVGKNDNQGINKGSLVFGQELKYLMLRPFLKPIFLYCSNFLKT